MEIGRFRYTIAGENNPYWALVEPILFRIWGEGIEKTNSINLHICNAASLVISLIIFAFGRIMRIALVCLLLTVGFMLFPQVLESALGSILSYPFSSPNQTSTVPLWAYQAGGYVIIITATVFVFGGGLITFLGETALHLIFAFTHLQPIRILARGLRNESYWAQLAAKTSFMGTFLVQSAAVMPSEFVSQWDHVFDLYNKSNTPTGRTELEKLAGEWSNRHTNGKVRLAPISRQSA